MDKKTVLLKIIMGDYTSSYEMLILSLEDNYQMYRHFYKVPAQIFVIGLLTTCEHKHIVVNGEVFKLSLKELKELIPEIISDVTGFETTYTDNDWLNLEIIQPEYADERSIFSMKDKNLRLNSSKVYLGEFFEI